MMITKKSLPRRAVLRGLGATVALPLLDGMVPALTATAKTAANPVRRLGVVYVPNGMNMQRWTPTAEGAAFALTPTLEPLRPFRDRMVVVSGLDSREALPHPGEGGGAHSRSQGTFLTCVQVKRTEGSDVRAGMSMDQMVAKHLEQETQLGSLELALEPVDLVGSCDVGYACAYTGTLAWRGPTTPLPMEMDPRAVFERLFGASDSTDPRARRARLEKDRSILDALSGEVNRFQTGLGPRDRAKVTEYLDAIRDVERRIHKAEQQSAQELPLVGRPVGIPKTFEEHANLMFDLLVLAYQTDLTRVATYLVGRELSGRTYPEIGVPESHHPVSHHGNNPIQLEKQARINVFHTQIFARFLEKMASTPDGDGSLLDHSMLIYGGGMSNSNEHDPRNLPLLLVGGGAGSVKGGRHLRFKDRPLADLHLTVLEKMQMPMERFGDSTGRIELLSEI